MGEVSVIERTCRRCGETKPPSAYYKRANGRLFLNCSACDLELSKQRQETRREEIGEETYREQRRRIVRASRARTGDLSNKRSMAAQRAAMKRLREAHPAEYDQLLRHERYARGLRVR